MAYRDKGTLAETPVTTSHQFQPRLPKGKFSRRGIDDQGRLTSQVVKHHDHVSVP